MEQKNNHKKPNTRCEVWQKFCLKASTFRARWYVAEDQQDDFLLGLILSSLMSMGVFPLILMDNWISLLVSSSQVMHMIAVCALGSTCTVYSSSHISEKGTGRDRGQRCRAAFSLSFMTAMNWSWWIGGKQSNLLCLEEAHVCALHICSELHRQRMCHWEAVPPELVLGLYSSTVVPKEGGGLKATV